MFSVAYVLWNLNIYSRVHPACLCARLFGARGWGGASLQVRCERVIKQFVRVQQLCEFVLVYERVLGWITMWLERKMNSQNASLFHNSTIFCLEKNVTPQKGIFL